MPERKRNFNKISLVTFKVISIRCEVLIKSYFQHLWKSSSALCVAIIFTLAKRFPFRFFSFLGTEKVTWNLIWRIWRVGYDRSPLRDPLQGTRLWMCLKTF